MGPSDLSCPHACSPAPLPRRFIRHGMLPQLAAFEAVVRLGSVTQAADELCMAQPTLSGHLRKLSDALGVRLFEPCGKRLKPTPAARVLMTSILDLFDTLARCDLELGQMRLVPSDRPALERFNDRPVAASAAGRADPRRTPLAAAPAP